MPRCLCYTQLVYVAPSQLVHDAGDHLVAIDGKNTQNMTMQEVVLQLFCWYFLIECNLFIAFSSFTYPHAELHS